MDWMDKHESAIRLVFRILVVALLALCWIELRQLPKYSPDLRTLELDVDRIQRDVSKIKEKIDPSPPSSPLSPDLQRGLDQLLQQRR